MSDRGIDWSLWINVKSRGAGRTWIFGGFARGRLAGGSGFKEGTGGGRRWIGLKRVSG